MFPNLNRFVRIFLILRLLHTLAITNFKSFFYNNEFSIQRFNVWITSSSIIFSWIFNIGSLFHVDLKIFRRSIYSVREYTRIDQL